MLLQEVNSLLSYIIQLFDGVTANSSCQHCAVVSHVFCLDGRDLADKSEHLSEALLNFLTVVHKIQKTMEHYCCL